MALQQARQSRLCTLLHGFGHGGLRLHQLRIMSIMSVEVLGRQTAAWCDTLPSCDLADTLRVFCLRSWISCLARAAAA